MHLCCVCVFCMCFVCINICMYVSMYVCIVCIVCASVCMFICLTFFSKKPDIYIEMDQKSAGTSHKKHTSSNKSHYNRKHNYVMNTKYCYSNKK